MTRPGNPFGKRPPFIIGIAGLAVFALGYWIAHGMGWV
jgi:hypothetical protein